MYFGASALSHFSGAGSVEGVSSMGNSFGVVVSHVLTLDGLGRAVVQVPKLVKRRSREGKQAKVA